MTISHFAEIFWVFLSLSISVSWKRKLENLKGGLILTSKDGHGWFGILATSCFETDRLIIFHPKEYVKWKKRIIFWDSLFTSPRCTIQFSTIKSLPSFFPKRAHKTWKTREPGLCFLSTVGSGSVLDGRSWHLLSEKNTCPLSTLGGSQCSREQAGCGKYIPSLSSLVHV